MALGHKALQGANGDGRVKLASSAGWFARMTADAAADRSKRIRDPGIAIRLLVPPLGDEGDVAAGLVWTGQACMQGKLDSSHSRSTNLVRVFKERSAISVTATS